MRDDSSSSTRDPVDELAEEFFARRRAGEDLSVESYAAAHPEWADELRDLLPTLSQLEDVAAPERPLAGVAAGRRLGDYRLVREVGRGGMGVVYEAKDERLNRRVALKILPPSATLDAQSVERFQREASAAARLHHPAIVSVYGVGEADGIHYFAMEFVDGDPLDKVLRKVDIATSTTTASSEPSHPLHAAARGPRAYTRCVARLVLRAAEALAHAHREGIVHRDIKPGNLILDADGAVRVADFGLCQAEGAKNLTQTSDMLGTLRYMAPEQLRGDADARSDICSLGLVLYELLTLRPAHTAEDHLQLVRQVADGQITAPRKHDARIPKDLETITLKAIDADPQMRYASAGAMARDMRAFLDDRPIEARRPSFTYLLGLAVRRNPVAAAAWALAAVVAVAGVLIYTQSLKDWQEKDRRLRKRAERRAYAASINAAQGALASGRTGAARQHLANCAEQMRGWEWRYLFRKLDGSRRTLKLDSSWPVYGLTMGPRGRRLVASSESAVILEWPSGKVLRRLRHPRAVWTPTFLDQGKRLATACSDGQMRIWDTESGRLEHTFEAHADGIVGLAYDEATDLLLTASRDGTVAAWNRKERTLRYRLTVGATVGPPHLAPDGKRFVCASLDNRVRVWRLEDGEEIASMTLASSRVVNKHPTPARFDPGGRILACGDASGNITIFDAKTYEPRDVLPGSAHPWSLRFVEKNRLAVAQFDGHIRIWDLGTLTVAETLSGHDIEVRALELTRGTWPLISSAAGELKVWELPLDKSRVFLRGHTERVFGACALDNRRLVTAGSDHRVRIWDVETQKPVGELTGHKHEVICATASPDKSMVVSGDRRGEIIAFDLSSGRAAWNLRAGIGTVRDIDFRADGKQLVAAAAKRGVLVLDPRNGAALQEFEEAGSEVRSARFLGDGGRIVAGHTAGVVEVREVASGEIVWRLEGDGERCYAVPNPAGTLIACGHFDGRVTLHDATSGRLLRILRGHQRAAYWPGFSPDGRRVATVSRDYSLRLWDVETGAELLNVVETPSWNYRAVFAPDGSWLAVPTSIGEVRVYRR